MALATLASNMSLKCALQYSYKSQNLVSSAIQRKFKLYSLMLDEEQKESSQCLIQGTLMFKLIS